jgi:hypothetical protein
MGTRRPRFGGVVGVRGYPPCMAESTKAVRGKAAPKKAPAKKATTPRKPRADTGKAHASRRRTAAVAAAAKDKAPKAVGAPRGGRLPAAQQAIRDSLMIQRLAQGWPWESIAEEAGISVTSAKKAVAARQDSAPLRLNMDPVEVIERVAEGYQLSIGDLEAVAYEAMKANNLTAAVGAKKAANDAREKLLAVFQATGRLPQELSQLRHLIDVRQIAVQMMDTMDVFERDIEVAKTMPPEEQTRILADAADRVRGAFGKLLGLDENTLPEASEEPEVLNAQVVKP